MNQDLWNSILAFDLDDPPGEYSFSIRLAAENYWTKAFTEQAIIEYKKFMYLAATSDKMVSPSGIVDEVWHQHLIFTKSYNDFCEVLGKQIQHVPSTHNREEFQKFQQAKERTTQLYEETFGPQPVNIWAYNDMFDSLHLPKAKLKIRQFLVIGILALIGLTIPAYFLLQPLYIEIPNPDFLYGLLFLSLTVLLVLEFYNRTVLEKMVSGFDQSSFIFDLYPFELIYLKTRDLSNVVNGAVSELVDKGKVLVKNHYSVQLSGNEQTLNQEQWQIVSLLSPDESTHYPNLMRALLFKPVFSTIAGSMEAFCKYFIKSRRFGRLFYFNFIALSILILLSFTRVVTGTLREKPVVTITILTFGLIVISIVFLLRLTNQVTTLTIPSLYKSQKIPTRPVDNSWQWQYFLFGTAVLATSFTPVIERMKQPSVGTAGSDSSGSSCGTSCGSSCGSSCGGCGGD